MSQHIMRHLVLGRLFASLMGAGMAGAGIWLLAQAASSGVPIWNQSFVLPVPLLMVALGMVPMLMWCHARRQKFQYAGMSMLAALVCLGCSAP